MKKKTGIILSSVAAIAVSASVIAGSTYALFTSEDKVNIAVSSANVEVLANVTGATLSRPTSIDMNTYAATYPTEGEALADVSGKEISLNDIQPGDKIQLSLKIESKSTVSFKYRVSVVKTGGDQNLFENLLVGIDGAYYSDYVSAWTPFNDTTEADTAIEVITSTVEILMPAYLGNEYKNLDCSVALKVEAVQGNVDKTAEAGTLNRVYPVYSQTELNTALQDVKEEETIVVMQKWDNVEFNTDKTNFNVKGCNLGGVTFNAPYASVDYDIDKTENLEVTAIADNSLHVFGELGGLEITSGRVVLESSAKVNDVAYSENADGKAKLDIKVGAIINNVAEGVSYTTLVSTEKELASAIAEGGNVKLVNDFAVNETINISKDVVLDLNGHMITNDVHAGRPFYIDTDNVSLTLNGEVEGSGMAIPAENTNCYGFVDMQGENITLIVNGGSYTGNADGGLFKIRRNGWNITFNNVVVKTNFQVAGSDKNGRLTVKGGEYTLTGDNNLAGFYLQAEQRDASGDAVIATFEGVKIYSEKRLCVEVTGSKATFKDCNFGNPDNRTDSPWLATGVAVDHMGNATIEGGTYSGGRGAYVYSSGGTLTINGGTFSGSYADLQADNGEIIFNNGTLTNNTMVVTGNGKITDNRNAG